MAKGKNVFLAGFFGVLAGALGGLLFAPKSGKETRKQISKLAADLAVNIKTEANETKLRIKDIYGNTTAEAERKYNEMRNAILGKVAAVKATGKEIDKVKYTKIVDEVVLEFKARLLATKESAVKFATYLKKDWDKVKKALV